MPIEKTTEKTTEKTMTEAIQDEARNARITVHYEDLVRLCRNTFTGAQYDASYHALAAALHCATDLSDVERLEAVETLATEQMQQIEALAPDYHHSTQSAKTRGNPSLLANLARQAYSQVIIIQNADRRQASLSGDPAP